MKRMKSSKEEKEEGRKKERKDYPQKRPVFNHLGEVPPLKMDAHGVFFVFALSCPPGICLK